MKLKNRYMKKMLLNLLVIMLSLFCITACGKIKKDPEVVKYITDKINQDINKAIPKDKLEIDSYKESISKTLKKREAQLAKNIKIEVTDVISSKEYIDMYVKELEERNKRIKEQGGMFSKAYILEPPSPEVIEEYNKNTDVVYYKYVITADIVNLDEILKELHPKMKEFGANIEIDMHLINDILSEKNVANLKYETVEDFGYFVYNTKTEEGNYVNAFFGLPIYADGVTTKLDILPFLMARGHSKYNYDTALKEYK